MTSIKRIIAAIEYREGTKEKKRVSELRCWYENEPEVLKKEIDEYLLSHKKETDILIEKIKYFLSDLSAKGMSDNKLYHIVYNILDVLEPPNCQKSHCQHHTTFGFCNCDEGWVPGKCKDHREYIDRKAKRENKTPGKYFPESGSRVTLVTWKGDTTGVIGTPKKSGGKWYFPFLLDGREMDVCIDEVSSIKNAAELNGQKQL